MAGGSGRSTLRRFYHSSLPAESEPGEVRQNGNLAERGVMRNNLIGYFVTRCRVGVASMGAAGEIANVSHAFQRQGIASAVSGLGTLGRSPAKTTCPGINR